jgi:hypothetical protein
VEEEVRCLYALPGRDADEVALEGELVDQPRQAGDVVRGAAVREEGEVNLRVQRLADGVEEPLVRVVLAVVLPLDDGHQVEVKNLLRIELARHGRAHRVATEGTFVRVVRSEVLVSECKSVQHLAVVRLVRVLDVVGVAPGGKGVGAVSVFLHRHQIVREVPPPGAIRANINLSGGRRPIIQTIEEAREVGADPLAHRWRERVDAVEDRDDYRFD